MSNNIKFKWLQCWMLFCLLIQKLLMQTQFIPFRLVIFSMKITSARAHTSPRKPPFSCVLYFIEIDVNTLFILLF